MSLVIVLWLWLYGCAAYSAGFFVPRGMKLFGWIFVMLGCALVLSIPSDSFPQISSSLLMATTFGALHLAYGIYLYVTEKGKNAS